MGGFSDPIIGGGGALVYPQIKSPNFSLTAQTGWAILKNGDAYFFNITTSGSVIISNGQGWFIYNGTPAPGNAPVAYGAAPGDTEDPFGNTLPQTAGGVTSVLPGIEWAALTGGGLEIAGIANLSATPGYVELPGTGTTQALQLSSGTGPEAGATAAIVNVNDSGATVPALQVVDGRDGNNYDTQMLHLANAANFPLTTALSPITGLSCPVAAAVYRVNVDLLVSIGATASALKLSLSGPAVAAVTNVKFRVTYESGTGESMFAGHSVASLASFTAPATTFPISSVVHAWISAWVSFTGTGTLAVNAGLGTTSTGSQVSLGSTADVMPV